MMVTHGLGNIRTVIAAMAVVTLSAAQAAERTIAYLGVGVRPLDPVLAEHLSLPEGIGLTVGEVPEDGPSRGVLEPNDILVKLDDQWLTDPRQLAALVRMRKPGEEVELELVRKGQTRKVRVRLGERPWSPLVPAAEPGERPVLPSPAVPRWRALDPTDEDDLFPGLFRRFRRWLEEEDLLGPSGDATMESRVSSSVVVSETVDGKSYQLRVTDGQRTFEVKDADGRVLFSGPANTQEEIDAIPQEYRAAFDRLSRRTNVRIFQRPGGVAPRPRPRGPAL